MSEIEFIGARVEKEIFTMIEDTAQEEHVDKSKALKQLVQLGRKQYLLQKYLQKYREGLCSLDKAAEVVGVPVVEMMKEAAKAEIPSTETIEEYKKGLELLKKH